MSETLGEKLRAQGFKNIYAEGYPQTEGIYEWINARKDENKTYTLKGGPNGVHVGDSGACDLCWWRTPPNFCHEEYLRRSGLKNEFEVRV